ncbi:MAG TPA: SAM-dependent methyltransferase [Tepidisphaeraceae bacterium]|jgi:23S rRNA (cytidine1920-2'-O)/16S rRNA (cytidine1409-2'-O)-methyltransferase
MAEYVSRAGLKLAHALDTFALNVTGLTCADLGSNVGGFVDVLLSRGAAKVYSIDTGYGVLAWKLRKDPRVIVMERTNAMHAKLPEQVQLVTIDVAWTKQKHILPAAQKMLRHDGICVTLIKPHYEADQKLLKGGVLPTEELPGVMDRLKPEIESAGFNLERVTKSPIKGGKGNTELLGLLRPPKLC